ncbi:MAG: DUF4278 domain-containing protein [Pleurocapsa sp. MO_226.B13]|nr:DUF4278 domain-containing protein [Pleurocapsa sp. MO_226.B13]
MQLHFLGKLYNTNNVRVETIPSDLTARFRGLTYHLRRPIKTYRSQLDVKIYRSIAYCKNS